MYGQKKVRGGTKLNYNFKPEITAQELMNIINKSHKASISLQKNFIQIAVSNGTQTFIENITGDPIEKMIEPGQLKCFMKNCNSEITIKRIVSSSPFVDNSFFNECFVCGYKSGRYSSQEEAKSEHHKLYNKIKN